MCLCASYHNVIYYGRVTNADQTLAAEPLDFGLPSLSGRPKSFEQLPPQKTLKTTKIKWLCHCSRLNGIVPIFLEFFLLVHAATSPTTCYDAVCWFQIF